MLISKGGERINLPGMDYAPQNEQGVVYLFSLLAPQLGFKGVARIQVRFPDCVARRRASRGDELVKIEFEYRSSEARKHGELLRGCDAIVCWIHDWPLVPRHLEIIELRKYVGMGFDVWIQPIGPGYWDFLDEPLKTAWYGSPNRMAKKGDLVLWYCRSPRSFISHISLVTSGQWRARKWGTKTNIKHLVRLKSPLHFKDLKVNARLRGASFILRNMQGGAHRATPWWPALYEMILARNHQSRSALNPFGPNRV